MDAKKIILIEDDDSQVMLYKTFLELRGFSVAVATNGAELGARLGEALPDIIVSDILLQGENGLELLAKAREDARVHAIPFVIFSNTNKQEYRDQAHEMGAADFLIKSETLPQQLAEKLKGILGVS